MKVAVLCAVVAGLGILGYHLTAWLLKLHYAECQEVVPGVLYRCGRMTPAFVEDAVRKHGIKTIVDLRGDESAPRGTETELDWARKKGLRYFNLRVGAPSPEQMIANFLVIATTPACQPVLVHCHHGRGRTGLCVGMYRITQQKWTVEQAFDEMVASGLFPSDRETYLKFLREHPSFDWKKFVTVDPNKPGNVEKLKIR